MKSIYKIMFSVSVAMVIVSLVILILFGLKLGIDFQGGSIIEAEFVNEISDIDIEEIKSVVLEFPGISDLSINTAGERGIILKMAKIDNETASALVSDLSQKFGELNLDRFDSIEASIGKELREKSIIAIIVLLIAIVIYISLVFRKMSSVLSPWSMGIAAIIALAHDIIIPIGIFAILSNFFGIEIGSIYVAALLAILGYSVSDTIVVFDRTRENILKSSKHEDFGGIVHKSILQTLTRSINTTLTTILSLIAIFFFGGENIKYFALAIIIGISLGAYSSIFVASPLLVWFRREKRKKV
ncbi:MAG: protein translocase subunit SecF [Parcubacteria group bacterium]